jgi:hypothetical protein
MVEPMTRFFIPSPCMRTVLTMSTRAFWLLGLAFLLPAMLASGCGDGLPPKGTVTGKVTANGSPVKGGKVVFDTKNGFGTGPIDDSGTYTVAVPVGDATIGVIPNGNGKSSPALKKFESSKTSGLKTTIKAGQQTYDIDLK